PAVEHLVEIVGEDLLPAVLLEDLLGQAGLPELARQGALRVPDVEVPDELLRDRRPTLHDVALRDVLVEGAGDPLVVEGPVLPEAGVLDRHGRLRQPGRDLREWQRLSVRGRRDDAEQSPVVRVEERVLSERQRPEVVEAAGRQQDLLSREGHGGEDERDDRREQERQEKQGAAALAMASTP